MAVEVEKLLVRLEAQNAQRDRKAVLELVW
jgi:hypothetical protein